MTDTPEAQLLVLLWEPPPMTAYLGWGLSESIATHSPHELGQAVVPLPSLLPRWGKTRVPQSRLSGPAEIQACAIRGSFGFIRFHLGKK